MRQRPDMPRWKIKVSPRSVPIRPYLARRPRPVTRAPVRRWRRSGGKARRRSARRASTETSRRPSRTGARPRTVVSTSGSSGMVASPVPLRRKGANSPRAHRPKPLLEAGAMDKVSFGFEEVAPEEKTQRVRGVFSSVAARYGVMNDLMSAGLHRHWKNQFVRRVKPRRGESILDMAGGTGDIAFRLAASGAAVTVADINPEMLAIGVDRAGKRGIDGLIWAEENAERLSFADKSFDAYTIAFGIRNVTDIP